MIARNIALLFIAAAILCAGCSTLPDALDGKLIETPATPTPKPEYKSSVIFAQPRPPTEDPTDINYDYSHYTFTCRGDCSPDKKTFLIFQDWFEMNYQSIGLLASVPEEPLIIKFSVNPHHESPHRCFLIITVTDPETGDVIIEEGFNRVYSSESPKSIMIRRAGSYHINIYGAMVDTSVYIHAGG
jgi:hypothetical protein